MDTFSIVFPAILIIVIFVVLTIRAYREEQAFRDRIGITREDESKAARSG